MREISNWSQIACATIGAYIGYFLGGWDGFLYALVAFVVIDYLTGVMVAILEKKLSSRIGARGIFKKVMILSLVAVANIIDEQLIKSGSVVRTAVLFFYISNEGLSIIENAVKIGLPIPEKLKKVFVELREDAGDA